MEKPGVGMVHTGNSSMERPASLAYLLIPRTVKDLVSRKTKQKTETSSKTSTCTHPHSHGRVHTHEHSHTETTAIKNGSTNNQRTVYWLVRFLLTGM